MCTYYKRFENRSVVHMTEAVTVEVKKYDTDSPWTWANGITLLRVAGMIWGAVIYLHGNMQMGVIVLLIASLTDWLDGTVARRLHQRSRLGARMDPVVDKFFMATVVGLAVYKLWPSWTCDLLAIIAFTELTIAVSALRHQRVAHAALEVVRIGKWGMFARMPAMILILWSTTIGKGPWLAMILLISALLTLAGFVFGMAAVGEYSQQTAEARVRIDKEEAAKRRTV